MIYLVLLFIVIYEITKYYFGIYLKISQFSERIVAYSRLFNVNFLTCFFYIVIIMLGNDSITISKTTKFLITVPTNEFNDL